MLKIETLTVGPLEANCHICFDDETSRAIVIDPGDDPDRILGFLRDEGLTVECIWLTHAHFDHIGALAAVKRETDAPVTIHELERQWTQDGLLNGSDLFGFEIEPCPVDQTWSDGVTERALGRFWRVHHVPGHSPGSVAIVCEKEELGFTGDLVFSGSVGRVDLPGGDPERMARSLRRFVKMPERIRCYVGHGPSTLIGVEAVTNFLIKEFLEAFPDDEEE